MILCFFLCFDALAFRRAFDFRRLAVGSLVALVAFLAVVRAVETAALEYDSCSRSDLPAYGFLLAVGAGLERFIAHFLKGLESLAAGLAFVLICRH